MTPETIELIGYIATGVLVIIAIVGWVLYYKAVK